VIGIRRNKLYKLHFEPASALMHNNNNTHEV
jgi:hypothetical protein